MRTKNPIWPSVTVHFLYWKKYYFHYFLPIIITIVIAAAAAAQSMRTIQEVPSQER